MKNEPPREEHKIVVAFRHSYRDNALHGFMNGMSKLLVSKLLDIVIHGNVLCAEYKIFWCTYDNFLGTFKYQILKIQHA